MECLKAKVIPGEGSEFPHPPPGANEAASPQPPRIRGGERSRRGGKRRGGERGGGGRTKLQGLRKLSGVIRSSDLLGGQKRGIRLQLESQPAEPESRGGGNELGRGENEGGETNGGGGIRSPPLVGASLKAYSVRKLS